MHKIALIGAGQLGSRHLQGIAKTSIDISVEIVEPFESSRNTAKERYEEVAENTHVIDINFYESIDQLSDEITIVIIATNADIRASVVKELLSKKKVQYLILEKVLFQTIDEYYEIQKLLEETSTFCWVNHPRRMFPFYKNLREELQHAKQICYSVQGGAWGIGCNGLHFIDHLAFLSATTQLAIDNDFLHPHIYDSKRANHIEFNGMLKGRVGNHIFTLYSGEEYAPTTITLTTEDLTAFIDEANGYARIARKSHDWKWEDFSQKIIYFQSELTNLMVDQIINTRMCDLPTYEEAMKLHIPFLETLLTHMKYVNGKSYALCPIT